MTAPTAVARCDWRSFIKTSEDVPADAIESLDSYFEPFSAVSPDENPCNGCGENLTPGLMGFITKGGFTWGLVHGEGMCSNCGWPARAHHFIKDKDGKDLMTLTNFVLQYHPDFVERRKKAK